MTVDLASPVIVANGIVLAPYGETATDPLFNVGDSVSFIPQTTTNWTAAVWTLTKKPAGSALTLTQTGMNAALSGPLDVEGEYEVRLVGSAPGQRKVASAYFIVCTSKTSTGLRTLPAGVSLVDRDAFYRQQHNALVNLVRVRAVPITSFPGIDPTGVTDSTAALVAAVAAAGPSTRVVIPGGCKLKVSSAVFAAQSRIELVGEGDAQIVSDNSGASPAEVLSFSTGTGAVFLRGIKLVGQGALTLGNARDGIGYHGSDRIVCEDVEVTNLPHAGFIIYSGTGRHSFTRCNSHANGYAGLIIGMAGGSCEVIGGNYSDNGPSYTGTSAYGITMNGGDLTVVAARAANNSGPQIDLHGGIASTFKVLDCDVAFGANNSTGMPGGGITCNGRCEVIEWTGNTIDGSAATATQLYAMALAGFSSYTRNLQRVSIRGNTFKNLNVNAVLQFNPWDADLIEVAGNAFLSNTGSCTIDIDPVVDSAAPASGAFSKRQIPRVVRIHGNTYEDTPHNVINAAALLEIHDETHVWKTSTPVAPYQIYTARQRVGRVLRRRVTISGGPAGLGTFNPDTYVPPTSWAWHVGDREDVQNPQNKLNYGMAGHVTAGSTSVVLDSGSPSAEFTRNNAPMIDMQATDGQPVTWGGCPMVACVAVNPLATAGQVVAVTALPADKSSFTGTGIGAGYSSAGAGAGNNVALYAERMCVVAGSGTAGTATGTATTTAGNKTIAVSNVTDLVPEAILSIAGVTFNGKVTTEVVSVSGYEGQAGTITVADAPDQSVSAHAITFPAATFKDCGRLAA